MTTEFDGMAFEEKTCSQCGYRWIAEAVAFAVVEERILCWKCYWEGVLAT